LVRHPDELDRQHRRRHHLPWRHQSRLTPVELERKMIMFNRFAALAACMLIPLGTAPLALADPPAPPADPAAPAAPVDQAADDGPPPDNGLVASNEPAVVTTPDGWVLTVA